MKLVRITVTFIVFFLLSIPTFADITGKIIVRGKWGDGEKEFGLDASEPGGVGPSDFTVSPNGDVYIADDLNHRIVVYDHNGDYFKSYAVDGWVGTIEVDEDGYIYYTCDRLKIINKDGDVIAASEYSGVVHLDQNKIYLWRDGTSYELEFNKKTNELRVIREIKETGIGGFIISSGVEYRRTPLSVSESTGIAHITINGKATQVKKKLGRNEVVIRRDSTNASGIYSTIVDGSIIDGDEKGNVYLLGISNICRINSKGELTGQFIPTNKDDLHLIYSLPYNGPGFRIKNDKIYSTGSTPYNPSHAIRVNRGSTNYLGSPDDEFMIIEYEFQPVE